MLEVLRSCDWPVLACDFSESQNKQIFTKTDMQSLKYIQVTLKKCNHGWYLIWVTFGR